MYAKLWDSLKGTQICLLAKWRFKVPRTRAYISSEISDSFHGIVWIEKMLSQLEKVQPLVGSAPESAIVQIEAIYIYDRSQSSSPKIYAIQTARAAKDFSLTALELADLPLAGIKTI